MNLEFIACEKAKATPKTKKENDCIKRRWDMNEEGFVYCFLGDTYSIKEELKAIGAKFDYTLGWHTSTKPETDEFPFVEVHISDICYMDPDTGMYWEGLPNRETGERSPRDFLDEIKEEALGVKGNTVGNVGDRGAFKLTLIKESHWEEQGWGYYGNTEIKHCYTFQDDEGNIFAWFTTSWLDSKLPIEELINCRFVVTGTIKAHDVYQGVRRTVLTRCRIKKEDN